MQRRNFLVGIGSASVGGSALLGSGAFSRVESQRSVSVNVAEDHEAYLGLDKCNTPNGSYAHPDSDGHLEILLNPDNPTIGQSPLGEGINSNSTSRFDRVFQLCNNGKQSVCLYIEDNELWPRVPEADSATHAGDRRVEFYLENNDELSIVGEENAFTLDVGVCVCIGIRTRSYGLQNDDVLLDALDNEIRIIADVDGDCSGIACPVLRAEYECTTYTEEDDGTQVIGYNRQGTRFRVFNDGPDPTLFDLAVADSPGDLREDVAIGANTSRSVLADASVPMNAVLVWDAPEECRNLLDIETWAEYKQRVGVDDLVDWYETFGTSGAPAGVPQDFDDDFAVEADPIPEQAIDPANTLGPDEEIDPADYPDMSPAAEDEGWITCAKQSGT